MRFEVREVAQLAQNGTKWHEMAERKSGGEKEVAFLNAMFYYCDI
ncbi:MAG: hypothetical protein RSB74_06985 [Kiritimatiellia bacterium]